MFLLARRSQPQAVPSTGLPAGRDQMGSAELPLSLAPLRTTLVMKRADGSPDLCRRLAALGLRRGAAVRLVQATSGGGRIVSVAGSRIALDRSVLDRLFVEAQAEAVTA